MPHSDGVDATSFNDSLAAALNLIGKSDSLTTAQLTDFLYETAYKVSEGSYIYRRFLAAALWLESRPKWLIKGEGAEWEGRASAVSALKQKQRGMDSDYNIIPVFSAFNIFAGVSR